jgi:hypothetical protein
MPTGEIGKWPAKQMSGEMRGNSVWVDCLLSALRVMDLMIVLVI